MAISLTNVTGAAVTGFTTPGYNVTADTAPAQNAKQWAVTSLTGTQTGVDVSTVSKPFTISFFRPQVLKPLPPVNPTTGVLRQVPVNTYKVITRKGALPLANQAPVVCRITTTIDVFAGCDTYEAEEVKALISAHVGALNQQSSGLADTVLTGVL